MLVTTLSTTGGLGIPLHTRTVCAAPAKQHRHIDLHIRMNHTRTTVDEDRSDTTKGRPHCSALAHSSTQYTRARDRACTQWYAHAQTVYKDGVLSSASVSVSPVLPFLFIFTYGHYNYDHSLVRVILDTPMYFLTS